ncbi:MAG: sensor histidine kinase, partial [Caldilineaceae bacterium]|nr:sensor histidine kinase [Caldilineaceae bacterium]
ELHDSVTQALYSTTLFAEAGRELAALGDLPQATHLLQRVGETSQQALKEVRLLVDELRPVVLEKQGLVGALQQRLDAVEKRAGVEATLVVNDPQGLGALPTAVEETLYRIAQEALNNALKHANATAVTVALSASASGITLQIHDDGVGFDPAVAAASGGLGLTSMRERIQQHHGAFTVHSTANTGTTIHVTIAP